MARDTCDVAVIGAGPYGLAIAAHLASARIDTRLIGDTMAFWRNNMPKGMRLRSPWRASQIAHPHKGHSLDDYARLMGVARSENLPLADFVKYGEWFQATAVPDMDRRLARSISPGPKGFRLRFDDADSVDATRVVVATGLTNQAFRPSTFDGISTALVSHSSEVVSPDDFRGRRVAVIGRGQSACESAVLLHEAGADVELICRGDVHWIGAAANDAAHGNTLKWHLREALAAPSAVGPFPLNWLVDAPGLLRRLPPALRTSIAVRSLRPAASAWLRRRADGMRINAGRHVVEASSAAGGLMLRLDDGTASRFDHAVLATGYRVDIEKLGIVAPELLRDVHRRNGYPLLSEGFESTVPGLYFVGSPAVGSFGPLPRFVAGTGYAARALTRDVLAGARSTKARGIARPALQPR